MIPLRSLKTKGPARAILLVLGLLLTLSGCNIKDPYANGGPGGDDASSAGDGGLDAGPTDARDQGNGGDTTFEDVPLPDGGMDMNDGGMGGPLTAANFFERYGQAACQMFLRLNAPPEEELYWMESVDDCLAYFGAATGELQRRLAHDAERNRVVLDVAKAQAMLDRIDNAMDPRVIQDVDIQDLFIAKAGPGTPCASEFSCIQNMNQSLTCGVPAGACEGRCVERSKVCGKDVCLDSEYCDPSNTCVPKLADGQACQLDVQCTHVCLVDGAGVTKCGTLRVGEDCSTNPASCPQGAYCTAPPDTKCAPRSDVGGFCNDDDGCKPQLICVGGSCETIDPGDRCRNDSFCPQGMACASVAPGDSRKACYVMRNLGDPCGYSNMICPADSFCSSMTGNCEPAKQINDACQSDVECAGPLVCERTTTNDSMGTCAQYGWGLAEDDPCNKRTRTCGFGLVCETPTSTDLEGVCTARLRPQVNGMCEYLFECENSVCNFNTNRCTAQFDNGQMCDRPEQCKSFYCDQGIGTCQPLNSVCP